MILENRKQYKKKLKQLKKYLLKQYYKHNQMLYITTFELWEDEKMHSIDIVTTDEKGEEWGEYLFSINTLKMFEEVGLRYKSYMKDNEFYNYFDTDLASITPFYFERTFTLKKFSSITEEDVKRCTRYFVKKILNEFWIWNIKFVKFEEKTREVK